MKVGDRFVDGGTPFHSAVRGDNQNALLELLRYTSGSAKTTTHGFEVLDPTTQQSPLHLACELESFHCLELFLSFEYSTENAIQLLDEVLRTPDGVGESAMSIARNSGSSACVECITKWKAAHNFAK